VVAGRCAGGDGRLAQDDAPPSVVACRRVMQRGVIKGQCVGRLVHMMPKTFFEQCLARRDDGRGVDGYLACASCYTRMCGARLEGVCCRGLSTEV
jgi:hypothetical protein